jgi:hypothetical protein
MPEKRTKERIRAAKKKGNSPSTRACEMVREEIHHRAFKGPSRGYGGEAAQKKHGDESSEAVTSKGCIALRSVKPRQESRGGAKTHILTPLRSI